VYGRAVRILTWNLLHGRSVPSAGRDLTAEFAARLASWEWDAALLQEVPPWWPETLARAAGAVERLVLTSRNGLLPVRRAVATRWPDVIKSNGGGANAILVRGDAGEQRTRRLSLLPERRWLHAVALGDGTWVGNLHATVHDAPKARREAQLARATMLDWAAGASLVLGGDFNLRAPELELDGLVHAGGHDVDHVFAVGLQSAGEAELLERGELSDHAPVLVTLTRG
jgi:endonuclease/exonuclease/phosphatase family metal-dependent hydrolase